MTTLRSLTYTPSLPPEPDKESNSLKFLSFSAEEQLSAEREGLNAAVPCGVLLSL